MKPIEVVQYDYGVQLVFEVMDIDLDALALYATLFVRKPSGKFVFQEDNISITGNTVTINLENQALTEPGKAFFQIKFKANKTDLSTYSGMLTVEKSLEDSGAEESKTVIAAFDKLTDEEIAKIEEATRSQIELMKAEVEAKGETVLSTIPDEYTEMYNRVNTLFNSVANAIKGTVSGSVVRVDDVSPVEHKPVVKVVCPEGVDPSTVKVTRCGKNLLSLAEIPPTSESSGITGTFDGDVFTLNGTATASGYLFYAPMVIYGGIGESYTLRAKYISGTNSGKIHPYLAKSPDKSTVSNWLAVAVEQRDSSESYALDEAYIRRFWIYIPTGTTLTNFKIKIQLEKNDKYTDYEAFKEVTMHTPSSDGTVEGITSLSPVMTLLTDTEGVTIECEYNKDTGKVIEKLTNAVVALGGVV